MNVYKKYVVGDLNHNKEVDEVINNINNKKYMFYIEKSDKYKFFDNFISFYCLNCNNFTCNDKYCIIHYNKLQLNNKSDEYINKCRLEIEENYKEINKIHNEYRNLYSKNIRNYYKLLKVYYKYINNNFNFDDQNKAILINKKYINNKIINYENINTKFDETIKNIINNKEYNDNRINIYNIILYLNKKFINYRLKMNNFSYKLKKIDFKQKYQKIENNILLYNKLITSNIANYIDYIDTEYSLSISKHLLKFDIFMIISIDNRHFKILIETDECQHFKYDERTLKYDYYKDKFAIQNGYSMIRIDINKKNISSDNIEFVLFCIKYILETKETLYYFNNKYINYLKTINNTIYDEFSDIETIYQCYSDNDSDGDS